MDLRRTAIDDENISYGVEYNGTCHHHDLGTPAVVQYSALEGTLYRIWVLHHPTANTHMDPPLHVACHAPVSLLVPGSYHCGATDQMPRTNLLCVSPSLALEKCPALTSSLAGLAMVRTGGIVGLPNHHTITPAADAEPVWINGTPHLVTAELATWAFVSQVKPERIPGYWYGKKDGPLMPTPPVLSGQKVFYLLHGGGYTQLSAHPDAVTSNFTRALVELDASAPHALALEYRLSTAAPLPDQNPFPAALLDALAGYSYLVDVMGYPPSNVIIVGDSAGGNLALALTRYLVEHKNPDVPLPAPPGHLILLSPWADLTRSHDYPGSSMVTNAADYLDFHDSGQSLYSKRALLGPFGLGFAFHSPYVSPASLYQTSVQAHFGGFPRTFIATGTAERLYDVARTLRTKMTAEMGQDQVAYFEGKDAVHDFVVFAWHPCRSAALEAIQHGHNDT